MSENNEARAPDSEEAFSGPDSKNVTTSGMDVDDFFSFTSSLLPQIPMREVLAALETKPVSEMKAEWPVIAALAEPWILSRWASAGQSAEERLVFPLLRRKWPSIKAAVESLLDLREKHPGLSWLESLDEWMGQAPKEITSLFELPHALWLETVHDATDEDAPDAIAFAKDMQALVTAAERMQERWFSNQVVSPSQGRFRAQVANRISELARIFTGIPQILAPSAFGPALSNPLPQVFSGAQKILGNAIAAVATQGKLVVLALKKILPDRAVATGHRPTTSQRDHRIMLLAEAGSTSHEIAKYVSARTGEDLSEGAVQQAIARARQRITGAAPTETVSQEKSNIEK